MNKIERFRNAFYAQAVCDAVGDPFEFDSDIKPSDVVAYAQNESVIEITDDTQMALFIAEHLDFLNTSSLYKKFIHGSPFSNAMMDAYVAWYKTQRVQIIGNISFSELQMMPEMQKRKSPGDTCMEACRNMVNGEPVENDSKGCGSVMRILPFAWFDDLVLATSMAIESAEMTHKHAENKIAVHYLMDLYYFAKKDVLLEFPLSVSRIDQIGEGWTALECVKMAHWSVTKAKTFDELLELSIAHDGDSDSVAAVAGSIWGLLGREVPVKYIEKIAEKNAIDYVLNLPLYKENHG